jgi:hypothetical protein
MATAARLSISHGALRIQSEGEDGPSSTLKRSTLEIIRVDRGVGEVVQITLTIDKLHHTRTTSAYGYIELTPEEVGPLITALTKLHPIDRSASKHRSPAAIGLIEGQ